MLASAGDPLCASLSLGLLFILVPAGQGKNKVDQCTILGLFCDHHALDSRWPLHGETIFRRKAPR